MITVGGRLPLPLPRTKASPLSPRFASVLAPNSGSLNNKKKKVSRRGCVSMASSASPSGAVIWLHGLGDNGPNNESIRDFFDSPELRSFKWLFPSAPSQPVKCNYGAIMPSWFDIPEIPVRPRSPNDEGGLLRAVQKVHEMIDKEVDAGIAADRIFLCGFSQGGALTLASTLLYPKRIAGAAVFSGWVPFSSSNLERMSEEAKKTTILWQHGVNDPTVLFEAGKAGPAFLSSAGIQCEFMSYAGLGHSITPQELAKLQSWMVSIIKRTSGLVDCEQKVR